MPTSERSHGPRSLSSRAGSIVQWLLLAVIIVLAAGLTLFYFPNMVPKSVRLLVIGGPPYGTRVDSVESPDGKWTAELYQDETPGATGDSFITVTVRSDEPGSEPRPVYSAVTWDTRMRWTDPDRLRVNGVDLDVGSDVYLNLQ